MAARLAPGDYDQLHHFIADGVWDAAPLEAPVQADRLVGGKDAVLVIDDAISLPSTAVPLTRQALQIFKRRSPKQLSSRRPPLECVRRSS